MKVFWLSSLSFRVSYLWGRANFLLSNPGNLILKIIFFFHQWHFHSVIHLMAESLIGSGGGILIQAGAEIFLFAPLGMVTEVSVSCPPGCLRWSWGGFPPGGVKVLLDVINDLSLVCLLIIFGIAPLLPSLIKLWGRDPKSGMKKFILVIHWIVLQYYNVVHKNTTI